MKTSKDASLAEMTADELDRVCGGAVDPGAPPPEDSDDVTLRVGSAYYWYWPSSSGSYSYSSGI